MTVTLDLSHEQAETLLRFLRRVLPANIEYALDGKGTGLFNQASEKLRGALRKSLEAKT